MKFVILAVTILALNSCNTCIGIGRDVKTSYQWTKSKFQGSGGQPNEDFAPVY